MEQYYSIRSSGGFVLVLVRMKEFSKYVCGVIKLKPFVKSDLRTLSFWIKWSFRKLGNSVWTPSY